MPEPGRIVLAGMEFYAHHGAMDEEARLGARFVVDLEIELPMGTEDRLAETVDYSRVYELVARLVTGSRHRLIETLAATVAAEALASEPNADAVIVRVHKPHAPLPGIVRDVFVEVRRERRG